MVKTVNQALIDEIVSNVLARLQPAPVRTATPASTPAVKSVAPTSAPPQRIDNAVPMRVSPPATMPSSTAPVATVLPASSVTAAPASAPTVVELLGPIITADLLDQSVRPGQTIRIGRNSILTPSARDWLNTKRTSWSRQDRGGATASTGKAKWQIILQTVTPTVRSLQEGLRRLSEGWKIELVGQPLEAAKLATNLINTAECDGVVIFTEQADLIACQANRSERVRAAVMQNSKHWEQVMQTLSANVVCISPIGRTFIELRNLLRDCAGTLPKAPAGM